MSDGISPDAAVRIEGQLRQIAELLERLVRVEERQGVTADNVEKLDRRVNALESAGQHMHAEIHMIINRGLGAVTILGVLWTVLNSELGRMIVAKVAA